MPLRLPRRSGYSRDFLTMQALACKTPRVRSVRFPVVEHTHKEDTRIRLGIEDVSFAHLFDEELSTVSKRAFLWKRHPITSRIRVS